MKKYSFRIGLMIVVLLLATIMFYDNKDKSEEFLVRNDLQDMSVEEIVASLEDKRDEPIGFQSGITSTKLLLSDEEGTIEIDLPNDQFYLSVAPYINQTHPCGTHNLVTCQGELANVALNVLVTDSTTNEVIVDSEVHTYSNGFAGLWLPKDRVLTITVTYESLQSTKQISTSEDDNTCETTMRLL